MRGPDGQVGEGASLVMGTNLGKLEELCHRQISGNLTKIVRCVGWKRLVAVVSESGLGAQAASSGSLVIPAWVGAALVDFSEPCGIFSALSSALASRC